MLVSLLAREQEFQRLQAEDALAAAATCGFEAEVVYAEGNAILQIQQLYRSIHLPEHERPRAIVVETVVGEGLERVARAATAAGMGWVLINRRVGYLDGLRREHPQLPICMVSTDQVEVGRIQGRQFRALIASGVGLVLYVMGPADTSVAQDRLQGAREAVAGTRIELRTLDGQWTEASGEQALQSWLRLATSAELKPAVVGCQNDAMAVGARRALQNAKGRAELARVPLTGCDGLLDGGRRLVDMRQLAATVVVPSNTRPAIELVRRALETGLPPPAEVRLQPSSYPAENQVRPA